MIDVAVAIDGEGRQMILHRKDVGSYTPGGRYVAGASRSLDIVAVEQPLNARDTADLREGIREKASVKFYSRTVIENDDVIEVDGRRYRILHVWDRQFQGGHSRVAGELMR